jgi:hypothetical protein
MICLPCPNCAAELEFADDLAGFETACYACAHPLKVPPAPDNPDRPPDPWSTSVAQPVRQGPGESTVDRRQPIQSLAPAQDLAPSYRFRREPQSLFGSVPFAMRLRLLLGAIVIVTACIGLYLSGGGITIYVDNGSKEPMIVAVDGKEEPPIAPGQFATINCQPGERRLQVRCGQEILFDGIKNLEKPDKLATNRRYFFNPDNRNRYRTYTIQYGSSPLGGLVHVERDTPSADRRTAVRAAYRDLLEQAKLLPPDPWFEVPQGAYVLMKAPECVTTRRFTETRMVMTRVQPDDYAFIVKACENKEPSEDDLEALFRVVDRVLESEP